MKSNLKPLLVTLFLLSIIVGSYIQVINYGFINYDDPIYVTENRFLQDGITWSAVKVAFVSVYAANWHPLTWLSHMLDIQLYRFNPGMHHLTNVLFHLVNSILLFFALKRMTRDLLKSAAVAVLFAIHPLHVESVAWVSERKDVLSAFFWMLTIFFYSRYAEKPGIKRYSLVFLACGLGLMAKPMLVTLPFVLLLLDYWPLGRISLRGTHRSVEGEATLDPGASREWWSIFVRLIIEKIPLFILVVGAAIITFIAQKSGGAVGSLDLIPLSARLGNAVVAYGIYLLKTIWPMNLSVFYPYSLNIPLWKVACSAAFLAGVSAVSVFWIRRFPYLIVGWLWYLGTLIPVIGLIQVGSQSFADRYTYIPLTGIFIMLAWGLPQLFDRGKAGRFALQAISATGLVALLSLTWLQVSYWKNDMTLFRHAIEVTQNNYLAHNILGKVLLMEKKYDEAVEHFREAIRIKPTYAQARVSLGITLYETGQIDAAIDQYKEAIRIKEDFVDAYYNLAVALKAKGDTADAIKRYRQVLSLEPYHAKAHNNLGYLLSQEGKYDEAIIHYRQALSINHRFDRAYMNLVVALNKQNKHGEAMATLVQAISFLPEDPSLRCALGDLYRVKGQNEAAGVSYQKALDLEPGSIPALRGLIYIYSEGGENEKALEYLDRLQKIRPNDADIYYNIACLNSRMGKTSEAIKWLRTAIEKGFKDRTLMSTDKDLNNIRSTSEYREIILTKHR